MARCKPVGSRPIARQNRITCITGKAKMNNITLKTEKQIYRKEFLKFWINNCTSTRLTQHSSTYVENSFEVTLAFCQRSSIVNTTSSWLSFLPVHPSAVICHLLRAAQSDIILNYGVQIIQILVFGPILTQNAVWMKTATTRWLQPFRFQRRTIKIIHRMTNNTTIISQLAPHCDLINKIQRNEASYIAVTVDLVWQLSFFWLKV